MSRQVLFVAGTDTGAGKTFATARLLQQARAKGLSSLGLKPLAAGSVFVDGEWKNDDALLLQQASSVQLPYADVNPFCFVEAVAPHIAAQKNGISLTAEKIAGAVQSTMQKVDFDYCLIEGAGGWLTPLNAQETLADVARHLQLPVILVVGMKLGCLNHALLTAQAIHADGLRLHGWIANDLGAPMPYLQQNIETLETMLNAPRIAL